MILADKIIDLRKKAGCSQEELAQQLGVSRQSVSKWEGAQSIPDIDKILQMSRIFGVSTDYLLKDEIELPAEEPAAADSTPALRRVSMEEASRYLELRRAAAPRLALRNLARVPDTAGRVEQRRFHPDHGYSRGEHRPVHADDSRGDRGYIIYNQRREGEGLRVHR